MKSVIIPSDTTNFMKWLKGANISFEREYGTEEHVVATQQTILSITPRNHYCYDGLSKSLLSGDQSSSIRFDDNLLLTIDIIKEYYRIINETLDPKVSTLYHLTTGLPIPYKVIPKKMRNFVLRKKAKGTELSLHNKLPLDALRFLLVKGIEEIMHENLIQKTWNEKHYVYMITHDVDTCSGLKRAKILKTLELMYDVPSTWYIPAKQYELNHEIVKQLAEHGEIGAHDTRHDGKLAQLNEYKMIKRLREAKQSLENTINDSVYGFRAPLLQHSFEILRCLKETGYSYDSSIPTWEPSHPRTRRPHGVGTTYPMFFSGLTEIPISVVQDHQLLYVLGLKPKDLMAEWFSTMTSIKDLGGCCVFLSHPEYKIFNRNNLPMYEEFLNIISCDRKAWTTTPRQFTNGIGK